MIITLTMLERYIVRLEFYLNYYGPIYSEKYVRPFINRNITPYIEQITSFIGGYSARARVWFLVLFLFLFSLLFLFRKVIKNFISSCFDFIKSGLIRAFEIIFYYPLDVWERIKRYGQAAYRAVDNFAWGCAREFNEFISYSLKKLYSIFILSEQSPLNFLAPILEFLFDVSLKFFSWIGANWIRLLFCYIFLLSLYRFYRWYRYKVPYMEEIWFEERGPTLLFLYRLRRYWRNPEILWDHYKYRDPFWDGVTALFMVYMYYHAMFSDYYAYWFKRYVQNIDGYRWIRHKQLKKKYLRTPPFRVFIRFHFFFVFSKSTYKFFMYHFCTLSKLFVCLFSNILSIVAILLFASFLWLGFHKIFFDYFVFFILSKLGFKFPRASLYTQPISTNASTSDTLAKFKSSLVSLKLNSLVDLKNTNLYSLSNNKIFTQLPFIRRRKFSRRFFNDPMTFKYLDMPGKKKRHRARRFISAFLAKRIRDYEVAFYPSGDITGLTTKPRVLINYGPYAKISKKHFHLTKGFNILRHNNMISRHSKLEGSFILPKFISNKRDINTFVLKELLLSITNNNNNFVKFYDDLGLVNNNYTKDLSIPHSDLFNKLNFFFFNKDFNKVSSNRKSTLLSDLCYSFLGRFRFRSYKNPTFFYDSPIYRHRTGGNFRYKNVYSYSKRSVVNGFKFLNNFRLLGSFPRKRIKVYNPYNNRKKPALLVRSLKFNSTSRVSDNSHFNKKGGRRRFYRKLFRYISIMGAIRLMSIKRFRRLIRRRKAEDVPINTIIGLRKGTFRQRKFLYKRLLYGNKLSFGLPRVSFFKKRYKVFFDKKRSNPKIAFKFKSKFGVNKRRIVFPALMPQSVRRFNKFNFMSLSSGLKSLRRNIVFLLRYKNKRKFFKHGTRFLIRSQLFSKKDQICSGRVLRRFFTKNDVYLSFLKSIYYRNVKLLLVVKLVSSFIIGNSSSSTTTIKSGEVFSYIPLFHTLDRPWWHDVNKDNNSSISYFNFYKGARSAKWKLGSTDRNSFGRLFKLAKRPRGFLGKWINNSKVRSRVLARRYFIKHSLWHVRRKGRSIAIHSLFPFWGFGYWSKLVRVKRWFYKNYKALPSIFFVNPSKDTRWFAFDYVPKYFHKRGFIKRSVVFVPKSSGYGWISPLFYKFSSRTRNKFMYIIGVFIKTFWSRVNSLVLIFVLCVTFGGTSAQPHFF